MSQVIFKNHFLRGIICKFPIYQHLTIFFFFFLAPVAITSQSYIPPGGGQQHTSVPIQTSVQVQASAPSAPPNTQHPQYGFNTSHLPYPPQPATSLPYPSNNRQDDLPPTYEETRKFAGNV